MESCRALPYLSMKGKGEKNVRSFLGKYGILILALGVGVYAILEKLSIFHSMDFETIFLGMSGLWIIEMLKVEHELGELKGKKK